MKTLNGNYREFRLDNGLFVALQETPTQTVGARLRVNHGSLHEMPGEEGLAHFLEHCLMTGGSRKYSPEKSDAIEAQFGSYNAFTALHETAFPVDVLPEDLATYLDFVADLAFHPGLDQGRMDQERQRVLRETADRKSKPHFKDFERFSEEFFGKGAPQTYFVLGREEVVSAATPEDLRVFHNRGYHANNMDLVIVGALPLNIDELVHQHFADKPSGAGKKFEFPEQRPLPGKVILHTSAPEMYNADNPEESSAALYIAFPTADKKSKESYALRSLNHILGASAMSSRLHKAVSQQKGLAYGIGSQYDGNNNAGQIMISGSVKSTEADQAIDATFEEMKNLRERLVTPDEMNQAQRAVKYEIAKTLESNNGHVAAIEVKMDFGYTPEELIERMNAVTPEQVRDVARKYLPENREDGKYVVLLRDPLKK